MIQLFLKPKSSMAADLYFLVELITQEREVEQKFADGMLAKMSKITDLIAKLESLEGTSSADQDRVKKPCPYSRSLFFVNDT